MYKVKFKKLVILGLIALFVILISLEARRATATKVTRGKIDSSGNVIESKTTEK